MRTTKILPIAALVLTAIFVPTAPGGAPMGPPLAWLGEGQWSIGAEYGYENMDMEAFGTATETIPGQSDFTYAQPFTLDGFSSTMFFGTLEYGICDNWSLFGRVGAADAQDDLILHPATSDSEEDRFGYGGSFGVAWGVGTRATFCRWGAWRFGGVMQVTWFNPGDDSFTLGDAASPEGSIMGDANIDYWQTQVGLAAVYQMDAWSFWVGPFLQFTEGNLDLDGQFIIDGIARGTVTASADIEESSQLGGYFGANWEMSEHWNLRAEGQITGDSWLVGVGVAFIPGQSVGK